MPTTEELNHRFAGAKYFPKLDAKSGYWVVKLDADSHRLLTFQTHQADTVSSVFLSVCPLARTFSSSRWIVH